MEQTTMQPTVTLEYHKLCECPEPALSHNPHQCPRDGDETCIKCGRQVCDHCFYYTEGLCVTCWGKRL